MARGTPAVPNHLRGTAKARLGSDRIGSRENVSRCPRIGRGEHAHRTDKLSEEHKCIEDKRIGGSKDPSRREAPEVSLVISGQL